MRSSIKLTVFSSERVDLMFKFQNIKFHVTHKNRTIRHVALTCGFYIGEEEGGVDLTL